MLSFLGESGKGTCCCSQLSDAHFSISTTIVMHCLVFILLFIPVVVTNNQTDVFPDCNSGPLALFPICDHSLPARQRAANLVSRMTISKKASRLINLARLISRLGLPLYESWMEALHGAVSRKVVDGVPEPTSFPIPLYLGATFNLNLIHRIIKIISTEVRACNNENITGLNFTHQIFIFFDIHDRVEAKKHLEKIHLLPHNMFIQ
jgi:hypothetical protein